MGDDGLTDDYSTVARPRPASLVAGAALAVGMGLMQCIAVAPGALALLFEGSPTPREIVAQEPELFGQPMTWLLGYSVQWLTLQGVLGLLAVVSGLGVWLGRRSARRATQAVMLAVAASWLAVGVIMALSIKAPDSGGPVVYGALAFFRAAAVGVGTGWAAVSALPTFLLERQDVTTWFEERGCPTRG